MRRLSFIEDNIGKLRKSEVKVAEYIPEHAEKIIHFSLNELADSVGVSEPTVIRFCRALGFSGWQEFKIHLAQAIIPQVQNIHESISEGDRSPELVGKVCRASMTAIEETLQTVDYRAIEKAVETLSVSSKIIFHGYGGSAVVAMDAYQKFFRNGIPCEWFSDPHMAIMSASMMERGQTLLAISHSGASRDVMETMEEAKAAGANVIALVSYGKSPASKIADITIKVAASEVNYRFEPMSSRIAQLCIIDVLAVSVGLLHKEKLYINLTKSRRAVSMKRV